MVSNEAVSAARQVSNELGDMDVAGVGILAAVGGTGAVLSQEVAELVLDQLGRNPASATAPNLGISALAKVLFAAVWAFAGMRLGLTSGFGAVAVGVGAFGALVGAGVDLVDMLQTGGLPGGMPAGNTADNSQQRRTATPKSPQSPQAAPDGGTSDYGDNYGGYAD